MKVAALQFFLATTVIDWELSMKPGLTADTAKAVRELVKSAIDVQNDDKIIHTSPAADNIARLSIDLVVLIERALAVAESIGMDLQEVSKLQTEAKDRDELQQFIVDYIKAHKS